MRSVRHARDATLAAAHVLLCILRIRLAAHDALTASPLPTNATRQLAWSRRFDTRSTVKTGPCAAFNRTRVPGRIKSTADVPTIVAR